MITGKVIIVTNIPNPYRIPLFNEIHRQLLVHGIELKVIFGSESYSRRKFKLNFAECSFNYSFLDSGKYSLGDQEKTLFTYKGLIKALKAEQPDTVILSGFSIAVTKVWLYSLTHRISYCIWSGSVEKRGRNDSFLRRLQRKIVSSGAASFIAYGSLAAKYLQKLGIPERKIYTAINTVDTTFFSTETASIRKVLIPETPKRFTYIGYLSPRKNIIKLLEVILEFSRERKDFILDVIGDGEDKPNLVEFVQKNGLNNYVRFHGFRQKAELPAFLAKSFGFLFQTGFDIWGLVLNEAMAAGLPCICSPNAGAAADLIKDGETGFIIDYDDRKSVISKMRWILDNPEEAANMGQKARRFIEKQASLQVSASGFVDAILQRKSR